MFQATTEGLRRITNVELPDGGRDATGRLSINQSAGHIFIPNTKSNTVTVLDGATNHILATIATGQQPFGVAVNVQDHLAYVAAKGSNQLWVAPDVY